MFKNSKIGAICYYISDVDKTEVFYRDVLGLDVERMGDDGNGDDWLLAKTGNEIELLFFKQESRPGNSPIIVFDLPEGGIDDTVEALS